MGSIGGLLGFFPGVWRDYQRGVLARETLESQKQEFKVIEERSKFRHDQSEAQNLELKRTLELARAEIVELKSLLAACQEKHRHAESMLHVQDEQLAQHVKKIEKLKEPLHEARFPSDLDETDFAILEIMVETAEDSVRRRLRDELRLEHSDAEYRLEKMARRELISISRDQFLGDKIKINFEGRQALLLHKNRRPE